MSVKLLVFLRDIIEAKAYLDWSRAKRIRPQDHIIIAVSPNVRVFLSKRGLFPHDTLAYFDSRSHQKTLEQYIPMDAWIRSQFKFVDHHGMSTSYGDMILWYLRRSISRWLFAVEIVSAAIEKNGPLGIVVYRRHRAGSSLRRFREGETYFFDAARLLARERGLSLTVLGPGRFLALAALAQEWMRSTLNFWAAGAISFVAGPFYKKKLPAKYPRSPVIFVNDTYRMGFLSQALRPAAARPHILLRRWDHWGAPAPVGSGAFFDGTVSFGMLERCCEESGDSRNRLAAALGRLAAGIKNNKTLFSWRGVSLAPTLSALIESSQSAYMLDAHRRAAALRALFKIIKPAAVISAGDRDEDPFIGEICRQEGIPAVLISHGSHAPPKGELERAAWDEHGRHLILAPYPFVAVQSSLADQFLDEYQSRAVRIYTGPLIWGRAIDAQKSKLLRQKLFGQLDIKRVVVHASSTKKDGGRLYIFETPDEYVRSIYELAAVINSMPQTALVVCFRPSGEIGVDELKLLIPFSDRVILSVDEPFVNVLGMADLLVSFSSTTIEEALCNRVPVLLYGGEGRYQHVRAWSHEEGQTLPVAPVYHVGRSQWLAGALSQILAMDFSLIRSGGLFDAYRLNPDQIVPLDSFLERLGVIEGFSDKSREKFLPVA
ncbi:MAG: hypothetical protein HY547_03905 [Elusimicrobia bacterium]|nr:hypothetical protein [Elusimicrobiota bacterium]